MTTGDFASQATIAFVIFCDENALKASEREALAELIYDECSASVDDTVGVFPDGEAVFCEGDGLSAWHEERETEPPIEVVPESELSLSLARERRIEDAHIEALAREQLLRQALEQIELAARLLPFASFRKAIARIQEMASDALSSVPDGEGR